MLSCLSLKVSQHFYSVTLFIVLTLCSIFVIFADGAIYFFEDDKQQQISNLVIWVIVPCIMILFILEYLMICRLFNCKVLNMTSCDFVYVFSILSLIIELTRITPTMKQFNYYSLDEYDDLHHIDNVLYWKHKSFDSLIHFIIFLRVVHCILRTVLYYIYGKEFRQTQTGINNQKTAKKTATKTKNGYRTTEQEDEDNDISSLSSSDEQENEPEPIQPTIMDSGDTTGPLPNNNDDIPIMATRHSVDLLNSSDGEDITPKQDHLLSKLKLNLTPFSPVQNNVSPLKDSNHNSPIKDINYNHNLLSPPRIDIYPSDVDTQSIERIELIPNFEPQHMEHDGQETSAPRMEKQIDKNVPEQDEYEPIDKNNSRSDIIMQQHSHSHTQNGENWGIFPMFASKLGIIVNLCTSLVLLFSHPYLFMATVCIFGLCFLLLMYVSAHHFVQFIGSFLDENNINDTLRTLSDEDANALVIKQRSLSDQRLNREDIGMAPPPINKQIKSIVFNPNINKQQQNAILNPWAFDNGNRDNADYVHTAFPIPQYINNAHKDMEFRTGQDEIKRIVRNMLDQHNNDSRDKLREILSILQDIDVMDKGNIEEKIELDDELDVDTKRFLAQTLLSKHSMQDNYNTPRFDFASPTTKGTVEEDIKHVLITPVTSHDTASPQKSDKRLNVLLAITPQKHMNAMDDEQNERKYDEMDEKNVKCEVDIVGIIKDEILIEISGENLLRKLLHITPAIDKLTAMIMAFDGSMDSIELDALTEHPLLHAAMCIFLRPKYDFVSKLNISIEKFYNFVLFIERSYHKNNTYHNRMHATEVMLSTMIFIDCLDESILEMMSTLQIFAAFISAIIHDVDHPGNNNAFEINILSEKAILYSDQSVLEYHHLQYTFAALKKYENEMDFTSKWDKMNKKEFRKQCVYSVLATDLSKHFSTISHIKQLKIIKDTDLEYVFKSIIKMSDLSHVCKPIQQHLKWTERITKEFHCQGDKELLCGLDVSPLCNKQNTKIAKGQVGFIKHVVSPLYNVAQRFFIKNGKFDERILMQLNANRKYWEEEAKKQETPSGHMHATQIEPVATSTQTLPDKSTKSSSKSKHCSMKRPYSATFATSTRKIAILTNLENTPPPILPSSVRAHAFKPQLKAKAVRFFMSPSNKSQDVGKGINGGSGVGMHYFRSYDKIKGRKRHRSSSANSLELPLPVSINNNILTPRSILRLGSNARSTDEMFKSLTPKYAKSMKYIKSISPNNINMLNYKKSKNSDGAMLRTKSSDNAPARGKMHRISPKQFISPYSRSHGHDVTLLQRNDTGNTNASAITIPIHEEKSSSDNQQRFKFDHQVIQETK